MVFRFHKTQKNAQSYTVIPHSGRYHGNNQSTVAKWRKINSILKWLTFPGGYNKSFNIFKR